MRKKEIVITIIGAVISIGCIGYGVSFRPHDSGSGNQVTEEQYTKIVGTPAPDETIFDDNGELTKEAQNKFVNQIGKQKSKVTSKIDAKTVKEAKEMSRVAVTPADAIEKKITKENTKLFFEQQLKEYGVNKSYDVQDETQGDETTSKENPYYFMLHDEIIYDLNGDYAIKRPILCKEYDDGERLPKQQYTKEIALKKLKAIAQNYFEWIGGEYTLSDVKTWEIAEKYLTFRDEAGKQYNASADNTEGDIHSYFVTMFVSVDGYPVIGGANIIKSRNADENSLTDGCLSATYAECGLQYFDADISHSYQVVKQKDKDILSYKKAMKIMKQTYESQSRFDGGCQFEVQQAYLGYVWTGEKYLQPVWVFCGTETGIMDGEKKEIKVLINARTGVVYSTPDIQL